MYDGTSIVETSIDQNQPVIYVSFNYRVSGSSLECFSHSTILILFS
jgi:hypothetical protein